MCRLTKTHNTDMTLNFEGMPLNLASPWTPWRVVKSWMALKSCLRQYEAAVCAGLQSSIRRDVQSLLKSIGEWTVC